MKIFEKGQIGSLKIMNRVIMAPMNVGGNNDSDGCLSSRGIDYFVERAKGGTGMIVTGAVRVTREFERDNTIVPVWMLFADHMIHTKWISELSERCHDYGTKVCIQLTAGGGKQAGRYAQEHGLAIGPSSNQCFNPPHNYTRPLSKEEISKFIDAFEAAARIVKAAGADAIQLHGHEGYLMDQFSSPLWNRRTDEYGGNLKSRLLFARKLIEAVKRGAGKDFPVIYRYGLSHYLEGGRSIEEGIEMAKLLESYGADAIDIDAGSYEKWYLPHPPTTIPCGSFAHLAEKAKAVVSIPVISSARIGYPEYAEAILEKGQADFVCIGRPLIADSHWCQKAKDGLSNEIRPCLACHEGCLRRLMLYKPLSCAVNPLAGNEEYLKITKAERIKNVLVIGGGIAGMVAGITCTQRGHHVTLYEKEGELGGNFRLKFLPSFKDDYIRYIKYLKGEVERYDIKVVLNHLLAKEKISEDYPDVIVNAIGASFQNFAIEGVNKEDMVNPFDLYEDTDYSTLNVAIIGGGLVGVEAAINVAMHGGRASIIEKENEIAKSSYRANRQHLLYLLEENNIKTFVNSEVIASNDNKLSCKDNSTQIFDVPYTKISACMGMIPNKLGIEDWENVLTIGDAEHPDNVMNAVWSAYRKCRLI